MKQRRIAVREREAGRSPGRATAQERQQAEAERQRAEIERERAEAQQQRAERLAARLRELGLEPDE